MKEQNITLDINKLSTTQLETLRTCVDDPRLIKQINDRIAFVNGWMSEQMEKEYVEKFC